MESNMYINQDKLHKLRIDKNWSQDQLATIAGLNIRTIQRLEKGGKASNESLRALASAFEVPSSYLLTEEKEALDYPVNVIKRSVINCYDFSGTIAREHFFWFALFIILTLALAKLISLTTGPLLFQITSLVLFLPWLSTSTKRLRDAGLSPWWQLMILVPVAGVILLLYLLTFPTVKTSD